MLTYKDLESLGYWWMFTGLAATAAIMAGTQIAAAMVPTPKTEEKKSS